MLGITYANLRAHKGRLFLSSLAIVLATAFAASTIVLTDAMRSALLDGVTDNLGASDVVVTAPDNTDVPREVLTTVREVDSVAGAQRRVSWRAALRSEGGRLEPAKVVSVAPDTGVDWPEVTQGEPPDQRGEAVLDRGAAEAKEISVGDTVSVPRNWEGPDSAGDNKDLRVVGTVDVSNSPNRTEALFVGVTGKQLRALTDDSEPGMVLAVARDGISAGNLASEIDNAVAGQFEVRTAEEHASTQTSSGATSGMTAGLLGFAGIALFVAAIVIANTFNVLLAQRVREMALLRCVGATRGQVFRSVVAESVLLGLVSSAAGVLAGFGLAYGAGAVVDAMSAEIPLGSVTLSATAVFVPVAVGVAVTVGAALLPARAATRIPPVAALRDQGVPTLRFGWARFTFAVVTLAAGATGLALGLTMSPETGFLVTFAGGALAFLGVLLSGPTLIPPLVRLMGAVLGRVLGTPGRIAAVNVARNPRRSAATVSALLVGVTLISLMSVGAASVRTTVTSELDEKFPVDFMIRSDSGMPDVVADNVSAIHGLSDVTTVRGGTTDVQGRQIRVSGYEPQKLAEVTSQMPKIARLEQGEMVLTADLARQLDIDTGDTLPIKSGGESTVKLTVSSTRSATGDQEDAGAAYVTQRDLARIVPDAPIAEVFARAASGADLTQVSYAIDSATAGNEVTVTGTAETKSVYTETLDTILLVFAALMAVALIIAVLGIANTMALSIIERTRELALLRALGLTRGQLRATLAVEAALLAVVGALVGVGLGTLFGWAGITSMLGSDFEVMLGISELRLIGLIAGVVLAGLLASVLPARRAARTSVVSALADE